MWFRRRKSLSGAYFIIFLTLLTICLYLTFYDNRFAEKMPVILSEEMTKIKSSKGKYLHVRLDLTKNTAKCQIIDYLIIYILSSITNIERRDVLRSTWASKRSGVCFVFILGRVSITSSYSNEIQMIVNNEQNQFQDIVQIDHTENYANVIYKEIAALQWSHHFYPDIPYLFKTDDDLIVDTILVSSIVHLLVTNVSESNSYISKHYPLLNSIIMSSNRTNFFRSAWAMFGQPTVRDDDKYSVSKSVWPYSILPPYCSGFGWFMSKNIRNQLVMASYIYPLSKVVWVGDVFISGFLARAANVKCTEIPIDYDQTGSANCSCLMVDNPVLTVCSSTFHADYNGSTTEKLMEYRKAWKIILLRHNFTDITINDC